MGIFQIQRIEPQPVLDSDPRLFHYGHRPTLVKRLLLALLLLITVLIATALSLWAIGSYRVLSEDPTVWQSSIDRLNNEDNIVFSSDSATAPTVFVGSSSFRLFRELETVFYKNHVLKKAFGGAKINDLVHYKNDLILQYQPRVVVLYIGTNDILYRDYQSISELTPPLFDLLNEIQRKLTDTRLVLLAQRPIADPELASRLHQYNILLADYASQHDRVFYVDVNDALRNPDHTANNELLHWDGLHLNERGYLVWGHALHQQLNRLNLVD